MTAAADRRGFTLVEMMIATGVSVVIALALATLVVGVRRLTARSFGVAMASLDLRAERDRMQFHSLTEGGNARWAGLLSASKISSVANSETSGRVQYTAVGVDAGSGGKMSRDSQAYSPGQCRVDCVGTEELAGTDLFSATLTRTVTAGGVSETLKDRVVVPAFGVEQQATGLSSPGELLERVWGCE